MPNTYTTLSSLFTAIADAIRSKLGTQSQIVADNFPSMIESIPTGGNQPTLFAPIITIGRNVVSWSNDLDNGGFEVTLSADVSGSSVSSPLTITQQMDKQTLRVVASSQNFEDGVSSTVLSYITPLISTINPSNYSSDVSYPYTYLKFLGFNVPDAYVIYNDIEYRLDSSESMYIPVDLSQNNNLYLEFGHNVVSSVHLPFVTFLKSSIQRDLIVSGVEKDSEGIYFRELNMSLYDSNNENIKNATVRNSTYFPANYGTPFSTDINMHYYFNISITF